MKKLIITLIVICLPVVLMAQTTIKNNFVIERSSPSLHLKGSNGVINFNSGDVTLTNTSNTLTIVGGILALPANGLIINSINALYGETDTLSQKYATIASTYTQDQTNTLLAGKADTSEAMEYPAAGLALSTGSAWGTSITNNSTNWNTAYTDRLKWDGGATGLTPATGRTSLGGTTAGQAFFTLTNPSAITFPRINANNTVSALSASDFTTAIGASHIYSDTMSVSAGVLRTKATTLTTEPYSVQIFSSGGKDITHAVADSVALNGGVYKLYVYSVDALSGCKLKILY